MKLEIKIVDILRCLWGVTEQAQGYNLLLYFFFFKSGWLLQAYVHFGKFLILSICTCAIFYSYVML